MKKTIIAAIFMSVLAATVAYADDFVYEFKKTPCSDFGFTESTPNDLVSIGFKIIGDDHPKDDRFRYNKDKRNTINYARYNNKKYSIPPVENIDFEYIRKPNNNMYNWIYQKQVNDKYYLVVRKAVSKTIFEADLKFEQNKCFIGTIPKGIYEAEVKAKADAEQKAINDANNKKKWAEGE